MDRQVASLGYNAEERAAIMRYILSAGDKIVRVKEAHLRRVFWLPTTNGPKLQKFWLAVRDEVRERVSERAFELLDLHFNKRDAEQFHDPEWIRWDIRQDGVSHWKELRALLRPLGLMRPE